MPAIPSHKTATSDNSWDGPANEARLRSGEPASYYARAFAWRDPDANETTKAAYKFIHHFVSENGEPGAASIVACRTGIAVLNGARGGTRIPAADRAGVYRHLAAHLRDAGIEPPELKHFEQEMLFRDSRLRIKSVADEGLFTGYASTYGNRDAYGDVIAPGAFAKTLGDSRRRPLLWNHDPREPIGVVDLRDDGRGLFVDGQLALEVQRAREAHALLKMGAVRGMSIGFIPRNWEPLDDSPARKFTEIELVEVSLTAFPANVLAAVEHVRHIETSAGAEAAASSTAAAPEEQPEPAFVRSREQDELLRLLVLHTEIAMRRIRYGGGS